MKKGIITSIVILVIVAVSVILYLNKSLVYAQLNDWKLIPIPEHFTELYFVTYPTLAPSTVVAGTKVPFTFELHNVEGKDADYPYMVYFKGNDQKTTLIDKGSITLKDDESALKNEIFTVGRTGQTGNVVVYLTSIDRYIYFSVPNKTLILESATSAAR